VSRHVRPLGLSTERYDPIGRYEPSDANAHRGPQFSRVRSRPRRPVSGLRPCERATDACVDRLSSYCRSSQSKRRSIRRSPRKGRQHRDRAVEVGTEARGTASCRLGRSRRKAHSARWIVPLVLNRADRTWRDTLRTRLNSSPAAPPAAAGRVRRETCSRHRARWGGRRNRRAADSEL